MVYASAWLRTTTIITHQPRRRYSRSRLSSPSARATPQVQMATSEINLERRAVPVSGDDGEWDASSSEWDADTLLQTHGSAALNVEWNQWLFFAFASCA